MAPGQRRGGRLDDPGTCAPSAASADGAAHSVTGDTTGIAEGVAGNEPGGGFDQPAPVLGGVCVTTTRMPGGPHPSCAGGGRGCRAHRVHDREPVAGTARRNVIHPGAHSGRPHPSALIIAPPCERYTPIGAQPINQGPGRKVGLSHPSPVRHGQRSMSQRQQQKRLHRVPSSGRSCNWSCSTARPEVQAAAPRGRDGKWAADRRPQGV